MKKLALIFFGSIALGSCSYDHEVVVSVRDGRVLFSLPDRPSVTAISVVSVSKPSRTAWKALATESNGPDIAQVSYGQAPDGMSDIVRPEKLVAGQLYRATFITSDGGGYKHFAITDTDDKSVELPLVR